jgi:hypothetical protein
MAMSLIDSSFTSNFIWVFETNKNRNKSKSKTRYILRKLLNKLTFYLFLTFINDIWYVVIFHVKWEKERERGRDKERERGRER